MCTYHMFDGKKQLLEERSCGMFLKWSILRDVIVEFAATNPFGD